MFGSLDISVSAVIAQRTRIDTIAGNIANAFSTEDPAGGGSLYRRRVALFAPGDTSNGHGAPGVHVERIIEDPAPPRYVYDEYHPHAIQEGLHKGYVAYPNVDMATEMINAMEAVRAYEANITVMDMTKTLAAAQLELLS